ncbi:hypothetical protein ACVDFE_35075 [Lentzea chajnantorensis]
MGTALSPPGVLSRSLVTGTATWSAPDLSAIRGELLTFVARHRAPRSPDRVIGLRDFPHA